MQPLHQVTKNMRLYAPRALASRDALIRRTKAEEFRISAAMLGAEAEHLILVAQYIAAPSLAALDAADAAMQRYVAAGLAAAGAVPRQP